MFFDFCILREDLAKEFPRMLEKIDGKQCSFRKIRLVFTAKGFEFLSSLSTVTSQLGMYPVLSSTASEIVRIAHASPPNHPAVDAFVIKHMKNNEKWEGVLIARRKEDEYFFQDIPVSRSLMRDFRIIKRVLEYKDNKEMFEHVLRFGYCLVRAMHESRAESRGYVH